MLFHSFNEYSHILIITIVNKMYMNFLRPNRREGEWIKTRLVWNEGGTTKDLKQLYGRYNSKTPKYLYILYRKHKFKNPYEIYSPSV